MIIGKDNYPYPEYDKGEKVFFIKLRSDTNEYLFSKMVNDLIDNDCICSLDKFLEHRGISVYRVITDKSFNEICSSVYKSLPNEYIKEVIYEV